MDATSPPLSTDANHQRTLQATLHFAQFLLQRQRFSSGGQSRFDEQREHARAQGKLAIQVKHCECWEYEWE